MRLALTTGLLGLACACFVLAACGGDGKPANQGSNKSPTPKGDLMRLPVPQDYADKKPTTALDSTDFINAGKKLFEDPAKGNCIMCHGASGKGDGLSAPNYKNPDVADLTAAAFQDAVTDQYIYWRIKDVAASKAYATSGMLGYQNGTPEEIWSLVAYVRSLKGK